VGEGKVNKIRLLIAKGPMASATYMQHLA
jgi:hypothetical protein